MEKKGEIKVNDSPESINLQYTPEPERYKTEDQKVAERLEREREQRVEIVF